MSAHLLLIALAMPHAAPDTTVRLPRNGAIEIESRMRDVVLRTGTTDMVVIHGGQGELDGNTLSISGEDRRSRGAGPIEVTVPGWARVDVSSVGGNLTFNGTPERLHAETVNGFIHVNGGNGSAELETVAGGVIVNDFRGTRLSIDATGENVTVNNSSGIVQVDNVNGDVVLHGIQSSSVTAGSINGNVAFEGPLAATGSYEFNSQNGSVTLTLPGDVSARMRISTMNGELKTDIPAVTNGQDRVTVRSGTKVKHKGHDSDDNDDSNDGEKTFTAVFGSGAARVTVDVFNGSVIVKRAGGR